MKKIIVIGCPGSGKTTFAKKLCEKNSLPLFHLDSIWHKPDKTHISKEEFDEELTKILSLDSWVVDGNYNRTIERRIIACDSLFLFDIPREICLAGAASRVGKERSDMPWCETELDPSFVTKIEEFSSKNLPIIYSLIDKYKDEKNIVIFKSREEADEFILNYGVSK